MAFKRLLYSLLFCIMTAISSTVFAEDTLNIPILCYHNLNPTVPGSMNLTPERFESQIKWLIDNGFTIIPLKEAVAYLQGQRASLPPKSVVITADDGWKSVYTYMYPIVKKYNIPVTLFLYPEPISEGKNFLTWDEIKEMRSTGLFDIQGHTYSHPNFKHEQRDLSPAAYEKLVQRELVTSKKILEDKLGIKISYLAWPFGIYNSYLEQAAAKAGYDMSFSIDALPANKNFRPMAQPRYMIVAGLTTKTFIRIADGAKTKSPVLAKK